MNIIYIEDTYQLYYINIDTMATCILVDIPYS